MTETKDHRAVASHIVMRLACELTIRPPTGVKEWPNLEQNALFPNWREPGANSRTLAPMSTEPVFFRTTVHPTSVGHKHLKEKSMRTLCPSLTSLSGNRTLKASFRPD